MYEFHKHKEEFVSFFRQNGGYPGHQFEPLCESIFPKISSFKPKTAIHPNEKLQNPYLRKYKAV
jgi:hypothetical protein